LSYLSLPAAAHPSKILAPGIVSRVWMNGLGGKKEIAQRMNEIENGSEFGEAPRIVRKS
jgi:hypothetical protein